MWNMFHTLIHTHGHTHTHTHTHACACTHTHTHTHTVVTVAQKTLSKAKNKRVSCQEMKTLHLNPPHTTAGICSITVPHTTLFKVR